MHTRNRRKIRDLFHGLLALTALVAGFASAPAFAAEPPAVELAGGDQAKVTIVVVDPDGSLMKPTEGGVSGLAAASVADLKSTLETMTGATFTLETMAAYSGPDKPGVYVGRANDLGFGGIDENIDVYLNGVHLGEKRGFAKPAEYGGGAARRARTAILPQPRYSWTLRRAEALRGELIVRGSQSVNITPDISPLSAEAFRLETESELARLPHPGERWLPFRVEARERLVRFHYNGILAAEVPRDDAFDGLITLRFYKPHTGWSTDDAQSLNS